MKDKDPKYNLMLIFALVIVLAFDIFFVSHKEGYLTEEILSYELSNSEFTPIRLTEMLEEGPVWMSSSEIREHVSFYGNDSFALFSAYRNSASDICPPLYFMMLNGFCVLRAIFSYGTLSPWPGCILNIIFMMGSMLIISSFFRNVIGQKYLGPVAALFYGLSPAGIDTVLLTRSYGAAAFFCLAAAYLVISRIAAGGSFKKGNKKIIFFTVLGFLTEYLTGVFFFFLILSSVIYLVSSKKKKEALYLIRTMMISAGVGALLYPFVFGDIYTALTCPLLRENFASGSLPGNLTGALEKIADRTGWSEGGAVSMLVFVLLSALVAMLTKRMKFYAPVLFASACGYIVTVTAAVPSGENSCLIPVFPFVMIIWIMGLGFIIYYIAERFLTGSGLKKAIYTGVLFIWTVSCICLVLVITPEYLCEGYSDQLGISKYYSSYDAVLIYGDEGFYRNVPELMNYGNCLLLKEEEAESFDERLASLNAVIVIEGEGVDKDAVIRTIGNMYGFHSMTYLAGDGVFGDRVCLLSK